jgi:hypothetical protein
MLIPRAARPMMMAVSSFRFLIDLVEPAWDGSQDILLAGERLATGHNAKVGDVIAVLTASGVACGRVTGFPLLCFADRSWIGVTVSGMDGSGVPLGAVADILDTDPEHVEYDK